MKHMARFVSLLLALLMFASCAVAETQFPLTEEPVTLKIMAKINGSYRDGDFSLCQNMAYYEELTNVKIEWDSVNDSTWNNTLSSTIASEEYPDIIFRGGISNNNLYKWGQDGILVDLAPYLEQYAPNFWQLMEENPTIRMAVTAPDGGIYGLPQVILTPEMQLPSLMFLNQELLDAAKVELPTTTDELVTVLTALRDLDADGDGTPDGVIPMQASINSLYKALYGSFGLMTRGNHHEVVDVDPVTGELRIFAQSDDYRTFVEYMTMLYSEKLLDPEIFTSGTGKLKTRAANHLAGGFVATNLTNIQDEYVDEWVGLETALLGPDGYQATADCRSALHSVGNFAVTAACEEAGKVELAVKWVDYFYSVEGGELMILGREGIDWEQTEDGTYQYTEAAMATYNTDMTSSSFISQFSLLPGGSNPCLIPAAMWFNEGHPIASKAAQDVYPYINDVQWPIISWADNEYRDYNIYHGDIKDYISNQTSLFITGQVELNDDNWNAFVNEINALGADNLLKVYASALTRIYGEDASW